MPDYAIGQAFVAAADVIVRGAVNPLGTRYFATVNPSTYVVTPPAGLTYMAFEGLTNVSTRFSDTNQEFRLVGSGVWGDSRITGRGITASVTTNFMVGTSGSGGSITLIADYGASFDIIQKTRPDERIEAYFEFLTPLGSTGTPIAGTIPVGTSLTTTTAGVGYTNGIYRDVPLTTLTGTGVGARADIAIVGGAVASAIIRTPGSGYANGDTLRAAASVVGGGSPGTLMVLTIPAATVATLPTSYSYDFCGFNGRPTNMNIPQNPSGMVEVSFDLVSRGRAVFGKLISSTPITVTSPNG